MVQEYIIYCFKGDIILYDAFFVMNYTFSMVIFHNQLAIERSFATLYFPVSIHPSGDLLVIPVLRILT